MNGCVIPGTPIAVDTWKIRECSSAKLFFLTHLHGDHIVGLTSSWDRPLYCSNITAEILIKRYQLKPEYVKPLDGNDNHLVPVDQSEDCQEYVSVTLIDAKHCPGAVMFLFEGSFGKILHTGDFRYDDSMMDSKLKNHLGTIDVLYLDNTYCDPECVFPSRNDAMQEILDIVHQHKDHDVIFGIRNLGKEDLLVKIAEETGEWISVPGNILEVAETLNLCKVFLTLDDPTPHRLRVVPFSSVSSKNVTKWTSKKPTIVILPTALYVGINGKPFVNNENVFVVPYSDHSSYLELVKFVSQIQPKRIVPIVRANSRGPFGVDISKRADMSCFDKFLSKEDNPKEHITKKRKLNSGKAAYVKSVHNLPRKLLKTNDIRVTKRKVKRRLFKRKSTKSKAKGVQFDSNSESMPIETAQTSVNTDTETFDKSEDKLQNSDDSVLSEKYNFVEKYSLICKNKNENNFEVEKGEMPLNELNKTQPESTNSNSLDVTLSKIHSKALESKNKESIEIKKSNQPPSILIECIGDNTKTNGSVLSNPLVDNLSPSKTPGLQQGNPENVGNLEEKCQEDNISINHSINQCLSSINYEYEKHFGQETPDNKEKSQKAGQEESATISVPDKTFNLVTKALTESPYCDSVLNKDETCRNPLNVGYQTHDSETHQLPSEKIVLSVKIYSENKSKKYQQQEFYRCLEDCLRRAEEYASSSSE